MDKKSFNISSLSVNNKDKFLTAEFGESEVFGNGKILNNQTTKIGDQPVSQEILTLLQLCVPHMLMTLQVPKFRVFTSEYITGKKALTDAEIRGYYCSGITVQENGLVTIKGGIKAKNGRVAPLNANGVSINLEESAYPFAKELAVLVESIFEESYQYFKEGKFGVNGQLELYDLIEEPQGTEVQ